MALPAGMLCRGNCSYKHPGKYSLHVVPCFSRWIVNQLGMTVPGAVAFGHLSLYPKVHSQLLHSPSRRSRKKHGKGVQHRVKHLRHRVGD